MRPPIIALAGRARSGKDTVAQYIISLYGGYRYGLADPIKRMIVAGLGIHPDEAHKEDVLPVIGKSRRQLYQTLGTDWGRNLVHPNIWILAATNEYRARGPGMIVTDARFDNETGWVRSNGGLVIHIKRDSAVKVADHVSEDGVPELPQDKIIHNNGSLEDLFKSVKEALNNVC